MGKNVIFVDLCANLDQLKQDLVVDEPRGRQKRVPCQLSHDFSLVAAISLYEQPRFPPLLLHSFYSFTAL